MPRFGRTSLARLDTCHPNIIAVCSEVIRLYDFSIIFGHRSPEEQFKLYQKGREFTDNKWKIVDARAVVTYCDGFEKKSRHNQSPSTAVDIAPYPIDWSNKYRFHFLAGAFLATAFKLKIEDDIESSFSWGGYWTRFKDYPHFQIK